MCAVLCFVKRIWGHEDTEYRQEATKRCWCGHSVIKQSFYSINKQIKPFLTIHWIFKKSAAGQHFSDISRPKSILPPPPHTHTHTPPPYLQQTESAQQASSTQRAETSFWLPGAFHSSPRLYILLRLKVRGRTSGGGDVQLLHPCQPLCVRAAACPNHHRQRAERSGWKMADRAADP